MGTFKKYPPWTCWVKWGQIVSEPTMNSQCTPWVSDPLPPVMVGISDDPGSSSETKSSKGEVGSGGTGVGELRLRKDMCLDGSMDWDVTLHGKPVLETTKMRIIAAVKPRSPM